MGCIVVMPPVSAGSVVGSVVAAASAGANTATIAVSVPTGTANGDMMIAWQSDDFGTYANMTAPAGWTLLTGNDRGTNLLHLKIWTRVASSEPASYNFGQGSSTDGCVSIITLRSVNTSTSSWLYAAPVWAANSQTRTAPTVSGAATGAVLLCSTMADMNNVAATWTGPTGMIKQADVQSTTFATQSVASLLGPANPSGTKTFTCSSATFAASNGGIEWSVVVPHA